MRRKRMSTRKRDALRHAARALLLLLAANYLLHTGQLLPIQAIRETEEREGVYHTRVLRRMWAPEIYKTSLFYLTANENALLLGDAHFTYLGWFPQFGTALDCSGGEPLYAAERSVIRQRDQESTLYFFYGRVDDPAVETVEISLRYISGYDEEKKEKIYQEHDRLTAPIWSERDGRRYFLVQYDLDREDWPEHFGAYSFAIGKDASGEVLTEFDIREGSLASYG